MFIRVHGPKNKFPTKFSREHVDFVVEVFDVATDWLVHRVRQMKKRMRKRGS